MRDDFGISLFDMCKKERERQIMQNTDVNEELRILLIRLGVMPRLHGYDYLIYAIKLSVADREYTRNVTTRMYPVVAAAFGVEPGVVERNIRHAIEVAVARGRLSFLNEYLGVVAFDGGDRPTNADFISLVADKVSAELVKSGVFRVKDCVYS